MEPAIRVLIALVLSVALAQGTKIVLLRLLYNQKFHINDLVVTGNMPSAHSAIVTALAISIYFTEGLTTTFLLSTAFAAVVLRDALGVRRTAGEEGKLINQLIKKTRLRVPALHYSLGHTPAEVSVGVAIGIVSSTIVMFL